MVFVIGKGSWDILFRNLVSFLCLVSFVRELDNYCLFQREEGMKELQVCLVMEGEMIVIFV